MTDILPSYVQGAWWTPAAGSRRPRPRCATHRPANSSPGSAPTASTSAARCEYARTVGPAEPRRADLPPARDAAQAVRARPHRAQGRALRDLGAHRRDEGRLVGRHRRRHRRAVHVLGQGPTRDAERAGLRRRPRRAALEGRLIPRTAHLHAAARRGRADQRVQLPGVGLAREVRARVPRRRADARQAGDADRLPRRGVRAHPRRVGAAARGLAAARVSGSVPTLFDHLRLGDLVGFTGSAPRPPRRCARTTRVQTGGVRFTSETDSINASILGADAIEGTPEFDAFVRQLVDRDDLEGRAEVHRDPAGDRARGIRRRRRRRRARAHRRARRRRRPARRGRHDGPARLDRAARRGAAPGREARGGRRRGRDRLDGRAAGDARRRLGRRVPRRRVRHAPPAAIRGCREPTPCTRSRRSAR